MTVSSRFFPLLLSVVCLGLPPQLIAEAPAGPVPWGLNGKLPSSIRVKILRTRGAIIIGCRGAYQYDGGKHGKTQAVKPTQILRVRANRRGVQIGSKTISSNIVVTGADPNIPLTLNGRPYRGVLILKSRGSSELNVIEQLGLEEYLYGVLPREVGADWPPEALKAQAVASRSFVVANMGHFSDQGYDVSNDVFSQVFGGLRDERPSTNRAVDDTRGEVLTDSTGLPIQAFFHSSCGGRTENPRYVWKEMADPPNYLISVEDTYCTADPFRHWRYEITSKTLLKRLRKAGLSLPNLKKITVGKLSPSGRAATFLLFTSKGPREVSGNRFRIAVGPDSLRSTLITEIQSGKNAFAFSGQGWGHGVGLCQYGARGRAAAGHSYTKILEAYYPQAKLQHFKENS